MAEGRITDRAVGEDVREIPLWVQRYAQNRSLAMMVYMVMLTVLSAVIFVSTTATIAGYVIHGRRMMIVGAAITLASLALLLWIALSDRLTRLTEYYYRGGRAALVTRDRATRSWPLTWMMYVAFFGLTAVVLAAAVWVKVFLGPQMPEAPFMSLRYLPAMTALYAVPFMLYLYWRSGARSLFLLLWPILYDLWAVVMAIRGYQDALDGGIGRGPLYFLVVFLAMIGCGLIAGLMSYIYSRYALCKLREITAVPELSAVEGEVQA